jgi:hypothetical protein
MRLVVHRNRGAETVTVAYWVVASVLALFYLYSGGLKAVRSRDQLRPMMAWVDTVPVGLLRTIGVLEILGALGLILPPATGVAAAVAVAAAAGLAAIQIGATGLHLRRGEASVVWLNLGLLALAAVAIWLATIWL